MMYSDRTRELAAFIWLISLCIYGYTQSGFIGVFAVSFAYCTTITCWRMYLDARQANKSYQKHR